MSQGAKTLRVLVDRSPSANQGAEPVVLVDEDGNPVNLGGGSGNVGIGDVTGLQAALDGKADQSALADAIARIEALESAGD